jgi:hypothetical protein
MSDNLLDDFDFYSDLLMSIGTHNSDRPFTPIEVSDSLLRLQRETGDSLEELSKRVGLGKKKKISVMKKKIDTTQIKNFQNLQKLSRRNVYSLGWGQSKDGKVAMTLGVDISRLSNKDDQDVLFNSIIENIDTENSLVKNDVKNIVDRKIKSPEIDISEIIELVKNTKPKPELFCKIGIDPDKGFVEQFNSKISANKLKNSEFLQKLIQNKFTNNEIKHITLSKNNILWITIDDKIFNEIENQWKSKNITVTSFFNQILMESIKHD